jgi:FdhD protein
MSSAQPLSPVSFRSVEVSALRQDRSIDPLGEVVEEASQLESVIEEEVLEIRVNGKSFSMTMNTPGDERYLVRGLLHSEGASETQFLEYEQDKTEEGTVVSVKIPCKRLSSQKRQIASTSSCGLCGKKSAKQLFEARSVQRTGVMVDLESIEHIYKRMRLKQAMFLETGGSHFAAACRSNGEIICSFEDIGRHNAVDKVIGWLLEEEALDQVEVLAVSSRVSFEIVQKCARANIPVLTAISAPSSLAIKQAEEWGITLAGFCRRGRATFYSGLERLSRPSLQAKVG